VIRTQISFHREEYEKARTLAARRGVSLAELCRHGLREAAARESLASGDRRRPWMRHAGTLSSGDERASESFDAVVYDRLEP
jgi:hypothetical protein